MTHAPPPRGPSDPVRRRVLQGLAAAGGLVVSQGSLLAAFTFSSATHGRGLRAFAVVADLERCTGCRTCETACASYNHPVEIDGRTVRGLGNPALSNMRVHGFIPEVDVPVTCALCSDAPCIAACPVAEDERGRRALYRRPRLHTIINDPARCIGCRSCAAACASQRGGVIEPDPGTGKPTHICTLCDGEPRCALACPYDALSIIRGPVDSALHARPPEEIARAMMARWYSLDSAEVGP
jgi:carbon-monoxide dehydrogenase iron sulfur subunit